MDRESAPEDLIFAYHEAAHAVAGEVLTPRSILCASLRKTGAFANFDWHPDPSSIVAYTGYDTELLDRDRMAVMVAASRPGELLIVDRLYDSSFRGDDYQLEKVLRLSKRRIRKVRKTAAELVTKWEASVHRVALALYDHRYLAGYEIRELL